LHWHYKDLVIYLMHGTATLQHLEEVDDHAVTEIPSLDVKCPSDSHNIRKKKNAANAGTCRTQ